MLYVRLKLQKSKKLMRNDYISGKALTNAEKAKLLDNLEKEMKDAAKALNLNELQNYATQFWN